MAKKGKQHRKSSIVGTLLAIGAGAAVGAIGLKVATDKGWVKPGTGSAILISGVGAATAAFTTGKLRTAGLGLAALGIGVAAVTAVQQREANQRQLASRTGGQTTTGESRNGTRNDAGDDDLAEERLRRAKAENKPWTIIRERAA